MIRITKAKLTKDLIVEDIGLRETLEGGKAHRDHKGAKGDWIAHDDLVWAFRALNPHFAFINQIPEVEGLSLDQVPFVETCDVTSFSISGDPESEGISISGTRTLDNGLVQTLSSPTVKYDFEGYAYGQELSEVAYAVQEEVKAYYEGKSAPKRQMELFEENLGEDNVESEEPKKKSRKKKVQAEDPYAEPGDDSPI